MKNILDYELKESHKFYNTEENCCICHQPFKEDVVSTYCKHNFHKICIVNWLKIKLFCPLCRTPIKKKIFIRKYKNIEIIEETENIFRIKILDRECEIPIEFQSINKSDIDLIYYQTGENILKILYTFIKNKRDILSTVMDLID